VLPAWGEPARPGVLPAGGMRKGENLISLLPQANTFRALTASFGSIALNPGGGYRGRQSLPLG
jgi:hypothetical protein